MLRSVVCLIIVLLFLAGCATTGDPRHGGLYGWSPEKAQGRIEDLQLRRTSEDDVAYKRQEESQRLEKQENELKAEYTKQRQQLGEMEKKMFKAEKELSKTRHLSQTKKKEKDDAERKLDRIKEELAEMNTLSEQEIALKQVRITELNEELEILLQVIANL